MALSMSGPMADFGPRLAAVCAVAPALIVAWCKTISLPLDDGQLARTPFVCLIVYMLLLAFSNWPAVFWMALHGGFDNADPRAAKAKLDGLPARMHAAHSNTVEGLPVFLAGIFPAVHLRLDPALTAELCVLYIVCRIAYFPLYYASIDLLRTLVWATGFFASLLLAVIATFPELAPFLA